MQPTPSTHQTNVLIIDRGRQTSEVLGYVLRRRGYSTIEAYRPENVLSLIEKTNPAVTVLDCDGIGRDSRSNSSTEMPTWPQQFADAVRAQGGDLIVIGSVDRSLLNQADVCTIGKPYHYGRLVEAVESRIRSSENDERDTQREAA